MSGRLWKLTLSAIALSALLPFASGRMGESVESCQKRYGKEVASKNLEGGYALKSYFKKGYTIGVTFKDGMATAIAYAKPDAENPLTADALRDKEWSALFNMQNYLDRRLAKDEIDYFLKANSEGRSWDTVLEGSAWRRSDGAEATYDSGTKTLFIGSKPYMDFISGKNASDLSGL